MFSACKVVPFLSLCCFVLCVDYTKDLRKKKQHLAQEQMKQQKPAYSTSRENLDNNDLAYHTLFAQVTTLDEERV